jgi:hypothetical protein
MQGAGGGNSAGFWIETSGKQVKKDTVSTGLCRENAFFHEAGAVTRQTPIDSCRAAHRGEGW